MVLDTIKVIHKEAGTEMIINKCDFDQAVHKVVPVKKQHAIKDTRKVEVKKKLNETL